MPGPILGAGTDVRVKPKPKHLVGKEVAAPLDSNWQVNREIVSHGGN